MNEFRRLLQPCTSFVEGVSRLCFAMACVAVTIALFSMTYEVIARYLFNRPTIWAFELSSYMLAASVFLSVAYMHREDWHINAGAVSMLSARGRTILHLITSTFGLVTCALVTYVGFKLVLRAYQGSYAPPTLLPVPLWIPYSLVVLGFMLWALQHVIKIGGYIQSLRRN